MKEELHFRMFGEVRGFETELKFEERNGVLVPIDTGIVVPGTEYRKRNSLSNALAYTLAAQIGANVADYALNNLFASSGTVASVGAANNGKDGVFHFVDDGVTASHLFVTSLNDGGAYTENYIEFYSYIDGAVTLGYYLGLGYEYANATQTFTKVYAATAINKTVAANRRYHHYWKITIAI